MKTIYAILLLASIFLLAGCKSREAQLAGAWTGPGNQNITLNADKTFTATGAAPGMNAGGSWSLDADKVSMKITTLGGKDVGKFIDQQLAANAAMIKLSGKTPAQLKSIAMSQLAKPQVLTVSPDNKTMSSDATGPGGKAVTFTKSG